MTPALVLSLLVLAAATLSFTRWLGVVALALVSVLWLAVNGPVEGEVLWVVGPSMGLTGADLAGLAGLGAAGARASWLIAPRRH
ncbi:hypothetical protein [Nocardioides acrostichi]|uniref:Uncharacterized protein n=1 Tax=Nocardioides acrostichi TaxID=2784339 RepID=A0A930V232_9ACTN|nr:hypothetical protein [Nocardioides acrostichi]MBF4163992.1 hypothetical protein [Nocardioides acrostichi]